MKQNRIEVLRWVVFLTLCKLWSMRKLLLINYFLLNIQTRIAFVEVKDFETILFREERQNTQNGDCKMRGKSYSKSMHNFCQYFTRKNSLFSWLNSVKKKQNGSHLSERERLKVTTVLHGSRGCRPSFTNWLPGPNLILWEEEKRGLLSSRHITNCAVTSHSKLSRKYELMS